MRIVISICLLLFCGHLALLAQNPKPILSEGHRSQGVVISFDEREINRWRDQQPDNIDAFSIGVDLVFKIDSSGIASSSLKIPQADSWMMVPDQSALSPGMNISCYENQSSEFLWSVKGSPASGKRQMTPEIREVDVRFIIQGDALRGHGELRLEVKIYIKPGLKGNRGFGNSLPCESNLYCEEDTLWQEKGRSVVRIRVIHDEVAGWCSGVLLNNTAGDGRPFIYSAEHCVGNYTALYDLWRFDFLYQSADCTNPATEPALQSLAGCTLRAKGRDSDFLLLELNSGIPESFQAYFSGWNRQDNYKPDEGILLHHPQADIKKFSVDRDQVRIFPFDLDWSEGYTTPENSHYRLVYDEGGFEPGSSGGPIFDDEGNVIASLHGGVAGCEDDNLCYGGSLVYSWETGDTPDSRMKDWLDPLNTGEEVIGGIENPNPLRNIVVKGKIVNPNGEPMGNVEVIMSGDSSLVTYTNANGDFEFIPVSATGTYSVKPVKNTFPKNGITGLDLIKIQKHLLGVEPFTEEFQIIASDANGNDVLAATDILMFQRLILGKITQLPTNPSWKFSPAGIPVQGFTSEEFIADFIGIKMGDINVSANPNQ